jgi:hypothetical protein
LFPAFSVFLVSAIEGLPEGAHVSSAGVVRHASRKCLHHLRHAVQGLIVVECGLGDDPHAQLAHGVNGRSTRFRIGLAAGEVEIQRQDLLILVIIRQVERQREFRIHMANPNAQGAGGCMQNAANRQQCCQP